MIGTHTMKGLVVQTTDGELGTVEQLYFDDVTWAIRYLVIDTGGWLSGRQVLISPMSVIDIDWTTRRVAVRLTKQQVEDSPNIDLHQPVSRQHEAEFLGYYGYPYYWNGPSMWGPAYYPAGLVPITVTTKEVAERAAKEPKDSHLRSTEAVTGYHIDAIDGEVGHLVEFIVDEEAWAIRYLEVATKNWWPGKKVLVSPAWVQSVSWEESKIFVALSREVMKTCEECTDPMKITREYENRLYLHCGQPPYWLNQAANYLTYSQCKG